MTLPYKTFTRTATAVATATLAFIMSTSAYAADPGFGPTSQPAGQTGTWYSQAIEAGKTETVTVNFNGKKLEITVPAGTFPEAVNIFAHRISTGGTKASTGLTLASDNWDLRAERPSDGTAFTTFSKKVQLSIPFDTSVAGNKAIYYHDGKAWVKIATTITGGTATAQTDHFTEFAVLASSSSSTATPNVGGTNATLNWMLIALVGTLGAGAVVFSLKKQ